MSAGNKPIDALTLSSIPRLRPSDLTRIKADLDRDDAGWELSIKLAAYLNSFNQLSPVDLDDIVKVTIDMISVGLWNKGDTAHFRYAFGPMLKPKAREELSKVWRDYGVKRLRSPNQFFDQSLQDLGTALKEADPKDDSVINAVIVKYFAALRLFANLPASQRMKEFEEKGPFEPQEEPAPKPKGVKSRRSDRRSLRQWRGIVEREGKPGIVVVKVERTVLHPVLKKTVRYAKQFAIEDKKHEYKAGDKATFNKPAEALSNSWDLVRKADIARLLG